MLFAEKQICLLKGQEKERKAPCSLHLPRRPQGILTTGL